MVIAADIDPEPGVSEGFGFPAVGGAVLSSADDSRAGFTAVPVRDVPRIRRAVHEQCGLAGDPPVGAKRSGAQRPYR